MKKHLFLLLIVVTCLSLSVFSALADPDMWYADDEGPEIEDKYGFGKAGYFEPSVLLVWERNYTAGSYSFSTASQVLYKVLAVYNNSEYGYNYKLDYKHEFHWVHSLCYLNSSGEWEELTVWRGSNAREGTIIDHTSISFTYIRDYGFRLEEETALNGGAEGGLPSVGPYDYVYYKVYYGKIAAVTAVWQVLEGGGSGKYSWKLIVESEPQGMPFRLGGKTYLTPLTKTYSWSGPKTWNIEFEALPSEALRPYKVEIYVYTSPWAYSCAVTETKWELTNARFDLYVKSDLGPFGRAYYEVSVGEYGRVGYCSLEVRVKVYYSAAPAYLTVKTNIDGMNNETLVAVNGTLVDTPTVLSAEGGFTVELSAKSSTTCEHGEDTGLPDTMSVKCIAPSCACRTWTSETLSLSEAYVEFSVEILRGSVAVYRVRGSTREQLWSKSASYYKDRVRLGPLDLGGYRLEFKLCPYKSPSGAVNKVKVSGVRVYEESRYVFSKWVVFDEDWNVVYDPPANITITVPPGANWTAIAYYNASPTFLKVESRPQGVEVLANGTARATPFTVSEEAGFTVLLEAPPRWGGYVFANWTVYDSSGSIVASSLSPAFTASVPSGEYYRAVAFYRVEYESRRIDGSVYYLGYQWLNTTAVTLSPGLWIVDSGPVPPNPSNETLVYATLLAANGSYMLVPATRLLVNVTEPVALPALNCSGEYCEPKLVVEALNYSGYYLVGLGIGDWTKPGETEEVLEALLLPNGTTLAVYNVTLYNISGGVKYWLPVIVTSVKVELDALYAEEGVYLVWNVSYSHLAPEWVHSWLNVTEAKPYQLLKCRLYRGGRKLWEQDLWTLPEGLELPDNPYSSYAGLYVPYSELRKLFGFDVAVLEAKVEWEAIRVPLARSAEVRFAPLALGVSLDRDGRWIWTVYPVELRGYEEGVPVKLGGKLIVLFNGSRLELEPGGLDYDVFTFETPSFEVGHGTLVLRYVPPRTRNLVYYLYPADF